MQKRKAIIGNNIRTLITIQIFTSESLKAIIQKLRKMRDMTYSQKNQEKFYKVGKSLDLGNCENWDNYNVIILLNGKENCKMYIIMEVEKNNLKVTLFFFKMTLGKGRFWENELFQVYIIFTEIKER